MRFVLDTVCVYACMECRAPNTISYTGNNRTHMVRLPDAPRFELRLADAAVNPYLLPAGIAAAGLDGMANNADPGEMLMCNMYSNDPDAVKARAERETLPLYLIDALREFEQDSALQGIFGEEFSQGYLKLRWKQWNEYQRSMSAWEVANTLDC
jgi:glutamate---methylamine ligase